MEEQKTIQKATSITGIGLHTGKKVTLNFKPSSPDSGVFFVRTDLEGSPKVPARLENIIDISRRPRRTSVGQGDIEVHTIEHLLAALWSLGITNLRIELDGEEVPGLNGSCLPFIEKLKEAGIKSQGVAKKSFQLKSPIWMNEDGATLIMLPGKGLKIFYTLSYDHPLLQAQYGAFSSEEDSFEKEIAPSRTFCLAEEAKRLLAQGLGKGANYENTLVLGEEGIIKNKLRFDDEFVRHKILDLIGDLYLLGYSLEAHIVAVKSGHPSNMKLLRKINRQLERIKDAGVTVPATPVDTTLPLDINAIKKILPHRYPFLLVDKIIELEEDKRAVGIKNVSVNEPFFNGHFPDHPVMPAVLTVEAMAQVAGVLMLSKPENSGKLAYFMTIDNVKLRKAVLPGDQLRLEVEVTRLRVKTGQVHTQALVDGKVVAEADMKFSLLER